MTRALSRTWQPGDEMAVRQWGIREPLETAEVLEPDVLLMPLLAFDETGGRLGYGGGFYDRFFAQVPRWSDGGPYRLGITHIGGLLPDGSIDLQPHDQRIDDVIEG